MIRSEILLKNGRVLKNPSIFMELKTKNDGNLLKETIFRYPISNLHDGLNQIDGFSIPIGNYQKIAPFILAGDLKSAFDENHYSASQRLRLIDPSLYFLFRGSATDKKCCGELISKAASKIPSTVNAIAKLKNPREKTDRIIAGGLIPDMKKQLRAAYEREEQTKHTHQTSNPKP